MTAQGIYGFNTQRHLTQNKNSTNTDKKENYQLIKMEAASNQQHTNELSNQQNTQSNLQNFQETTNTYANKLKQNNTTALPKKDQAIIITAINEIQTKEYIKKLGELVTPKNILFASRISNNRICIYLTSKTLVDEIMTKNKFLIINNNKFEIRRLISPTQKVIISNVCPTIPNYIIEEALKQLGIKIVSQISYLRAGMQEQEFQHILSFRRQVYINQDEKNEIPETITVDHENITYRIFLSGETTKCTICNRQGHMANQCQINKEQSVVEKTILTPVSINKEQSVAGKTILTPLPIRTLSTTLTQTQSNHIQNTQQITQTQTTSKRPAAITSSDDNQDDIQQKKYKMKAQS